MTNNDLFNNYLFTMGIRCKMFSAFVISVLKKIINISKN